jgi:hypothetical protein
MGLNYNNVVDGTYVKSEITGNKDKDKDVRASGGNSWYLQVLASMVSEGKLSVEEFNNFFGSEVIGESEISD